MRDQNLRIVGGEAGEEAGEVFALAPHGDEGVRDAVEVGEGVAAAVLQLELEAAEGADALDGGRLERNDEGAGNHEELGAQAGDDFRGGVAFGFALVPST